MTMNDPDAVELLLVEDNPQDLELALRALKKANLTPSIHVACDGVDALEFIFCEGAYANRNISDLPKVIFLDLKLPRVDGIDVLKRLKTDSRTKMIPIVVLSSSREPRDLTKTYGLGVNSYVVKPVNFEGFVSAVKELGMYWLRLNQPPTVIA